MNICIEDGLTVISLQQQYIYAVYYDFFTLNFQRIGDKQKFRMNYKQMQRRVEVPQNHTFIMIVSSSELSEIDLALLNRFEKHVINEEHIFSNPQLTLLKDISNE